MAEIQKKCAEKQLKIRTGNWFLPGLMIVLLLIFVAVLSMIQVQGDHRLPSGGSVEAALDSYTVDMGREIAGSFCVRQQERRTELIHGSK